VVTIHFRAGAVPEEERRFLAGSHLRAVGSTIAFEPACICRKTVRVNVWLLGRRRGNGLKAMIGLILLVAFPDYKTNERQYY
jgi:hypothetical protein